MSGGRRTTAAWRATAACRAAVGRWLAAARRATAGGQASAALDRWRATTRRVAFGDRVGLAVFLASLCLFGLVWRTGFLITDSYTLANGLYALERGSLDMTTAAYSQTLDTPGTLVHDGRAYARNYGVLVAALPVLFALDAVSAVADLRIVVVATWSLLVLATALVAGDVLDRRRGARVCGSVAALGLFGANVALATPLVSPGRHLLALQVVHLVTAAFVGVFTYRLLAELHDRRVGVAAAALVTLGTPLAFWAAVPKRHVVTAAAVVAVAFAVARSRDGGRSHATAVRALAYVLVGLLAWVHAPEALVLFVALVVVDVPTAPANDRGTLAVVAGAFLLSVLPMFATNAAISGDPFAVPRTLTQAGPGIDAVVADGGGSTGGGGGAGGGDARPGGGGPAVTPGGPFTVAVALLTASLEHLRTLVGLVSGGLAVVVNQPGDVFATFVRSRPLSGYARRASRSPAANLSLLESAPMLAGLLAAVPAALASRPLRRAPVRFVRRLPPTDAFVALLFLAYSLVYASRLPLHAQVTVRYLFPLYPLAVYGLVRLPPIRGVLVDHWRTVCWSYAAALFVGGQLLFVALVTVAPGHGEAFQFHGLLALATAVLVGVWALSGRTDGRWGKAGAASMALATASATTFVLFVSIEYYALGDSHALPMVRAVAELVSIR